MELAESKERFNESLLRAVSRCREIGVQSNNIIWATIANSLDELRQNGMLFANAKSVSKSQVEADIKSYTDREIAKQEVMH